MNTYCLMHRLLGAALGLFLLAAQVEACEMLAYSFNQPVPGGHLWATLKARGDKNPDGWGVVFSDGRSSVLLKRPGNAAQSPLAEFLATDPTLKGRLMMAHLRNASVGSPAYENTHPFVHQIGGSQYALAHNGTLVGFREQLPLGSVRPLGTTDSEHLLCYLLGRIEQRAVEVWEIGSLRWFERQLHAANRLGSLNCLISDGTHLFVYRDKDAFNSLHYLVRRGPYGKVAFGDLHERVDLGQIYPAEARGVVVATRRLTDEPWAKCPPGVLMVFRDGMEIFSHPASATEAPVAD